MAMNKQADDKQATLPKSMSRNAASTNSSSQSLKEKGKAPLQRQNEGAQGDTLAVVLVRGLICSRSDVRDTLVMLRLLRKNACVLVPDTPGVRGMLRKAKDYVTWGRIDTETRKKLEVHTKVRGKSKTTGKTAVFHLHPPRKGFGRKGVKQGFVAGGALGDRGEKMNDLLQRMIG